MQVVSVKGRGHEYHYYACTSRNHFGIVPENCASYVRMEKIDNEVWDKVWITISEPGKFEEALQARVAELQAEEINAEGKIEQLTAALDDLNMERQRVITWARKKKITEDDLDTQLLTLTFQEREIQKELNQARLLTGNQSERLLEFASDYRQKVMLGIDALNQIPESPELVAKVFEFRRKIATEIVSHVEVMADESITVYSTWSFDGLLIEDPSRSCK
jgi:hypothetical protein